MKLLQDCDAAYIAGIVDGEGSVFFSQSRPVVAIKMVSKEIPNWLRRITGLGSLMTVKAYNERCRPQRRWILANRQAEQFLKQILKFLKLKRPQASAVIAFYNGGNRARLMAKVKRLNQRGVL